MAKTYREMYEATVESGKVTPGRYDGQDTVLLTLPARLELPDRHMWVHPNDDGTVRVEFERKDGLAELGFASTAELIEELHARMTVERYSLTNHMDLDYRTVDGQDPEDVAEAMEEEASRLITVSKRARAQVETGDEA
jgi:hypothetical protein